VLSCRSLGPKPSSIAVRPQLLLLSQLRSNGCVVAALEKCHTLQEMLASLPVTEICCCAVMSGSANLRQRPAFCAGKDDDKDSDYEDSAEDDGDDEHDDDASDSDYM